MNEKSGTVVDGQLLHMVLGGELASIGDVKFRDLDALDVVGFFPNYAEAYKAWKEKAQLTVDNAQMRYFIVHLHRLLDPGDDEPQADATGKPGN